MARLNLDDIHDARSLADRFGLRILLVTDRRRIRGTLNYEYRDAWVVYRGRVRLGKRSAPGKLLEYVRLLIGESNG